MLEIIDEIRPRKEERSLLRTLFLAFCGVCGLALFLAALPGCQQPAPLPVCEKYYGEMVRSEDGRVGVFMDMQNVKKLAELVTGLAAGTCRIEAPKPQGKPV